MAEIKAPDDHATMTLPAEALADLAEAAIANHRYSDAVEIYSRLASSHRTTPAFLARAHYARGLLLLADDARTEARMAFNDALGADPALEAARSALESISTTRIGRLT